MFPYAAVNAEGGHLENLLLFLAFLVSFVCDSLACSNAVLQVQARCRSECEESGGGQE